MHNGRVLPRNMIKRITVLCGSSEPFFCGVRDYSDLLNAQLNSFGISTYTVGSSLTPRTLRTFRRELADSRPDAVLLQYPNAAFGASLLPHLLVSIGLPAPLILVLHEFAPAHYLRKLSVSVLVIKAAAIVVTNLEDKKSLSKWFPNISRRIRVVPLASNIPSRDWQPTSPFSVGYFGLFRPQKGLEEFLSFARELRGLNPPTAVHLIGAHVAKFHAYGQAIVNQACDLGLHITVDADKMEVSRLLAQMSAVYLPFPDGASPRRASLLAAAVNGVPIISTVSSQTPPEMIQTILVARDPNEAAGLVRALATDPRILAAAHARSAHLAQSYTWESTGRQFIEMLDCISAGIASPERKLPANL